MAYGWLNDGKWPKPGKPPIRPTQNPLVKGALISKTTEGRKKSIFFQYNPESVKRTLTPSYYGRDTGGAGAVRFSGAPEESISLEILLDATEEMRASSAKTAGVRPLLAALSLLAYPDLQKIKDREKKLKKGIIEAAPIEAPQLLFVFGQTRVIPVQLKSISVTEQLFNNALTPVRATVALEMTAVSYSDVTSDNANWESFVSYQSSLYRDRGAYKASSDQQKLVSDV